MGGVRYVQYNEVSYINRNRLKTLKDVRGGTEVTDTKHFVRRLRGISGNEPRKRTKREASHVSLDLQELLNPGIEDLAEEMEEENTNDTEAPTICMSIEEEEMPKSKLCFNRLFIFLKSRSLTMAKTKPKK